jgi:predicted RNA-binding protein with PUA-like domain
VAYYLTPLVARAGVKTQGDTALLNNSPTAPVKIRGVVKIFHRSRPESGCIKKFAEFNPKT